MSAIERALAGTHEVPLMNVLGNVFSARTGSSQQHAGLNVSPHFHRVPCLFDRLVQLQTNQPCPPPPTPDMWVTVTDHRAL